MESAETKSVENGCEETSDLAKEISESSNNEHSEMGNAEKETISTATTHKEKQLPVRNIAILFYFSSYAKLKNV